MRIWFEIRKIRTYKRSYCKYYNLFCLSTLNILYIHCTLRTRINLQTCKYFLAFTVTIDSHGLIQRENLLVK